VNNSNITASPQAGWLLLFAAWIVVTIATMGSLFFSEIMEFPPCVLCWYQRICLFPLVIILMTGLFPFDKSVVRYGLPLALAGWLIALYHNLMYYGVIPESIQPCSQGVSCTEDYIVMLGFLTIPLLSLLSFSAIAALLYLLKRRIT
jgi:disulfide bond formation protein DsbB